MSSFRGGYSRSHYNVGTCIADFIEHHMADFEGDDFEAVWTALGVLVDLGVRRPANAAAVPDGSSIQPAAPTARVTMVHVPPESAELYGLPSAVQLASGQTARHDLLTCPECGKELKRQGYAPHVSLVHGKPADSGHPHVPPALAARRRAQKAAAPHEPMPVGRQTIGARGDA